MNLPKEYENVIVTYVGRVRKNPYGDTEPREVTRKGFYHKTDGYYNAKGEWIETPEGYFSIPDNWGDFTFSNGEVHNLPKGFGSDRVLPKDVISWKHIK